MQEISTLVASRPSAAQACSRSFMRGVSASMPAAGANQPSPYFAMRSKALPLVPPITMGKGFWIGTG